MLDPTKHADWEIAEEAESRMKTCYQLADELGLAKDELLPHGNYIAKVDYMKVLERLKDKPDGKFIEVTAITPDPAWAKASPPPRWGCCRASANAARRSVACIRQPSGGPTMNIKGSAAGGGLSQCIPLTEFSLGLTGDINAVMNAHNLAMVALTARMQHERNYDDARLAKSELKRLDIDPTNVEMGWVIDFCAQALRNIVIGMGGNMDGYLMQSKFAIAVSSEVMAILAVFSDLKDLRERMGNIVVAYDKKGDPVTMRRPGSGRRHDRLAPRGDQPQPAAVDRRPALLRPRRAVRQHRGRPVVGRGRQDLPEAGRLPRHRVGLRRRHRLREVLERQVPLLAATCPTSR